MTNASSHDIVLASQRSMLLLREAYLKLRGMFVGLYRPAIQDKSRADFFGDIRSDLTFEQRIGFRISINLPDLFRRSHQLDYKSDEWQVNPIRASCSLDTEVDEGDVIYLYTQYLTSDSSLLVGEEYKWLQVIRVESMIHGRVMSKVLKLAPYRDRNIDTSVVPFPLVFFADGTLGAWINPTQNDTYKSDGSLAVNGDLVAKINDSSGYGYEVTQPIESSQPTYVWSDSGRLIQAGVLGLKNIDVDFKDNIGQCTIIAALPDGISVMYRDITTGLYTIDYDFYAVFILNRIMTQDEIDQVADMLGEYIPAFLQLMSTGGALIKRQDNLPLLLKGS